MQIPASKVFPEIEAWLGEMVDIRRDIHAHPEIRFEEKRTAALVAARLREWGADTVTEGVGGTGVIATIRGSLPGTKCVALRADMDCLNLTELTGAPWASTVPGKMHACGHDGHTAGLLVAARYLAQTREFPGTVLLIFQPAEENGAGASRVVQDGLFTRWQIDEVYGLHNSAQEAVGIATTRPGPYYAACDMFSITVHGVGGHGSRPWLTADPLVAAQAMLGALQTIVSRNANPFDCAVVTAGTFEAGDVRAGNVIGDTARLAGTVRTFSPAVQDMVESRMKDICEGLAEAYGVTVDIEYRRVYPVTVNAEECAAHVMAIASELLGSGSVHEEEPMMGSEDFSFYLQEKPGAYFRMGNCDEAHTSCVHNPHYDFNDRALGINGSILALVAIRRLEALCREE